MNGNAVAVPAAQVLLSLIPMIGIVMASVLIFFYLLWRHRQIMRQIDVGIYVRRSFDSYALALFTGILLSLIGLVLTTLFLYLNGISYVLLAGLLPLVVGTSLLLVLLFVGKNNHTDLLEGNKNDLVKKH